MRWHYRFGHTSFNKLKLISMLGITPRKLVNVKPPKCATSIYGSTTRRPWRHKQNQRQIKVCTKPGECVSVDQLDSSTPGFIAQLKGRLTRDRYHCATVYVDHARRNSYIHLQRSTSSNETFLSKRAFESYARKNGVSVNHYHCYNGRFADTSFIRDVQNNGQSISYSGVNIHFLRNEDATFKNRPEKRYYMEWLNGQK